MFVKNSRLCLLEWVRIMAIYVCENLTLKFRIITMRLTACVLQTQLLGMFSMYLSLHVYLQ